MLTRKATMGLFALWFGVGTCFAQDAVLMTFRNGTGTNVASLHVVTSGGGGIIVIDPLTVLYDGNCPAPMIPSNPPTITAEAIVDFGVECVEPNTKVTFVMQTPAGPLGVVSCWWEDGNGVNMGGCELCGFEPSPFPPGFGAFKVQTRYFPNGPIRYTKWRPPAPGSQCWTRTCCNPFGWTCQCRTIFCPFTTRFIRLFELPPWLPTTKWTTYGFRPPKYWIDRTTVPPDPNMIAEPN
ncbi:MAG: hypothetical protein KDA32_14450, partial [Phycisphaerales bacterium]|nr:hypothetical protein [Phycisphaerales bacterium]